jgi:hypothetical protein
MYISGVGFVPTVWYVMFFILFRKSGHSLDNFIGGVMVNVLASSPGRANPKNKIGLGLWCLKPLSTIFNYILVTSFIGGGNRSIPGENHQPVRINKRTTIQLKAKINYCYFIYIFSVYNLFHVIFCIIFCNISLSINFVI